MDNIEYFGYLSSIHKTMYIIKVELVELPGTGDDFIADVEDSE